jgi:site-specific recombinase XerD
MLDDAIATARETGGPVAARDVAVLEVLYSTGIRFPSSAASILMILIGSAG